MRITRIKLVGYIGIYNGLGLNTIDIDLTNSRNNIVMIKGDNGCGKSTLWNAWHMFPDDNDFLVKGQPALKEIDIDNEYFISISYGVKASGVRETPKIRFLKRTENGDIIDLNPNLNVNSYKEAVYTEFNLDPNYISLSQLGQKCKGIAEQRPAERKKYMSAFVADTVQYNDMYKVLTKRSSTYKAFINNATSKISSIGDREYLKNTLIGVENRLNTLMADKNMIVEDLAKHKSFIEMNDPDGSIQQSYNTLYQSSIELNEQKTSLYNNITSFCSVHNISIQDIQRFYNTTKDSIVSKETDLRILENENTTLLNDRESKSKEIQKHQAELESIQNNLNITDLENQISVLQQEKNSYDKLMIENNIQDRGYTMEELSTIHSIISSISSDITITGSNYDMSIIQSIDTVNSINYDMEIKSIEDRMNIINGEVTRYNTLLEVSSVLNMRPDKCSIDDCPFITNAVKALSENPKDNIAILEQEYSQLTLQLQDLYLQRDRHIEIAKCNNDINILLRAIVNYKPILDRINLVIDRDYIIDCLNRGYRLTEELAIVSKYIDECNILISYNAICSKLNKALDDYRYIESKKDMIAYITSMIESLSTELSIIQGKIASNTSNINMIKQDLYTSNELLRKTEDVLRHKIEYEQIESKISDINSKIYSIQSTMQSIQHHLNALNECNARIQIVDNEIVPLIENRDMIKHNLKLLEEYISELEKFNDMYAKIEILKKYTSPSKGIGLTYMLLYLSSTLNLANDLLSLVFEGKFYLAPFEINENEFRIPCMGNAIMNDDISSMSGGEAAIIPMIIAFSILHQSSTKYNIFRLDEVDAPLDANNRRLFVEVLYRMIDILELDQVVIISHNQEIPMSNVDLIVLKTNERITEGHVIYNYTSEMNKGES